MKKGKIYTQKLDVSDPITFRNQSIVNDSSNYLHDKWRDDKDRFYSKIYFVFSLSATVLASLLLSWISFLILLNLLVIFLIPFALRFRKQKKVFLQNREVMKKSFRDWGLQWRD